MRRRTEAIIAAYFANSPGPLEALRDKYRVTHLLIDLEHFQGKPPQYFKPFDELIKRVTAQHEGGGYEVLRQAEHGIRMHDGHHVLIELDRRKLALSPSSGRFVLNSFPVKHVDSARSG